MRRNTSGGDPSEIQLLSAAGRLPRQAVEETVATLGEIYLRRARLAPESVSAWEIRLLRRSDFESLRAAAVVLWSRRRPGAFLRAAVRFLGDEPEVRCAVLEGVSNAAILEGEGPDSPRIAPLLKAAAEDASPEVRKAARETASLLEGASDDSEGRVSP